MPLVAFTTLGCKVNQYETELMESLFKLEGYDVVDFHDFSDVYVINTCSVTHLGEKKSRQLIRKAMKNNPAAIIAVTGCYAQVSPKQVEAIEGVDVIIGTKDRRRVVELVGEAAQSKKRINIVGNVMTSTEFEDVPLLQAPGRTRAFLKIQDGCTNFCTYCIIPYARGALKSRPLTSVRQEAVRLIQAGFKEIVLTGIHLGAYGRDNNHSLVDAVKTILDLDGLVRLRLGSLESIEVEDELIAIMKQDGRLCHHLHLPLQSGSDTILRAMNRHYRAAEYRALIADIREAIPDVAISTDIIVGFPGETDALFAETLDFTGSMGFARVHTFPYSKRQGTPAADYPDQVGEDIKKQRVQALQELAAAQAALYNKQYIGQDVQVLFENKKTDIVEGLTDHYVRVYAKGAQEVKGKISQVRIEATYRDGLWGVIV
ncbi:tRNA (N(6)-L-threonylcarbamoyladenosine(37)-C(2))-methylthiotransferase MtaB [Propionispora hippei]|uniref:Threonylcarbamoyladenosine tRNA methylthiotransferase MtaB n=1 Tax=Propionispora hippei DSM 15287 TaxID=1123003 RepID=A0A1M6ALR2_9FIRM|nr:tRNA (N(6)-L-threonylcarbamoyladenosine(37)-C(2))-methylthiotransferase MtaB [Propionispora hippei]SHI37406.1 threonylcarbamoyladenosine tRNA methylthiotransferase MtaB [Propionispora hippei DSM 15287]